jgi:spermidine/putrescine transport system permease protein
LSIARDWVSLGQLPGVDTFSAYTTIGYLFYAIPFVLFKEPNIEIFLFLNLLLFLLIVPFWTNFLLHVYAWFFVLEREGLVNTVLLNRLI